MADQVYKIPGGGAHKDTELGTIQKIPGLGAYKELEVQSPLLPIKLPVIPAPRQKPQQWGPFSAVQSALFHNLEKLGIDPAKLWRALPHWESAGNIVHDYANHDNVVVSNHTWDQNSLAFSDNAGQGYQLSEDFDIGVDEDFTIVLTDVNVYYTGGATQAYQFSNAGNGRGISIRNRDWSTKLNFTVQSGWTSVVVEDIPPTAGYYNYTCSRRNGAELYIHRNGRQVATGTRAGTLVPGDTTGVYIAKNSATGADYNGKLGEVLLFKTALNDSQIASLSDNPYQLWQPVPQKTYSISQAPVSGLIIKLVDDGFTSAGLTTGRLTT